MPSKNGKKAKEMKRNKTILFRVLNYLLMQHAL